MAEKVLMAVDSLRRHPRNPVFHPQAQIDAIAKSLKRLKQYKNIVVWQNPEDGLLYILAGHAVWEAAQALGWKEIWVEDRSDLDESGALALLAADNELARQAIADQEALSQIVSGLHSQDAELAMLAAGSGEQLKMLMALAGGNISLPYELTPDLEGWTEPETAMRIIIELNNKEEWARLLSYLGLGEVNERRIRYKFSATVLGKDERTAE